jgi:hypothetical protein
MIVTRYSRICCRCKRHLEDLDEGVMPETVESPVQAALHRAESKWEFRDLCDKCQKRVNDLVQMFTLDRDHELPQVDPIDPTENGFVVPVDDPASSRPCGEG